MAKYSTKRYCQSLAYGRKEDSLISGVIVVFVMRRLPVNRQRFVDIAFELPIVPTK
jgi:hypothetical protein